MRKPEITQNYPELPIMYFGLHFGPEPQQRCFATVYLICCAVAASARPHASQGHAEAIIPQPLQRHLLRPRLQSRRGCHMVLASRWRKSRLAAHDVVQKNNHKNFRAKDAPAWHKYDGDPSSLPELSIVAAPATPMPPPPLPSRISTRDRTPTSKAVGFARATLSSARRVVSSAARSAASSVIPVPLIIPLVAPPFPALTPT